MGYVHRTPAWAGPLGAKDRTTYWGVVPLKPDDPPSGLPPHPDEVPPVGAFGDWYDAACGYLWRAERVDLSLARLLAGSLLVVLQFVALVPLVQLAGSMLLGAPVAMPETRWILAGQFLLAVVWTGWVVYRRSWNRAWELRKAWSWAIHDPRVLELPERPLDVGEERDIDTDPEMTHPYRARRLVRLEDRPFVEAAFFSNSHTDRVRRREVVRVYLPLVAFFVALAGVAISPVWWELEQGQYGLLLVTYPLAALPPVVFSQVRNFRRILLAQRLAREDVEERHRWMGWQLLHGVPGTADVADRIRDVASDRPPVARSTPRSNIREARAAEHGARSTAVFGAAFFFGVFGLVGALLMVREPEKGLTFLTGLAFIGLVCLMLFLWHRSGRQDAGRDGTGFVVRVETPSSPRSPNTTVPSGDMVLTLSDGRVHLTPLDSSLPEVSLRVTALISGVGQLLRDGKHWLVLPDDSHVAVACSDYVGLRDAAADAGIPVLLPGPQPL
ncbi:hypothetical protein [Promicromonospora sp. NPDC023805]|uniref:hypothetical protein n=1 Tax=Promicromonospora sp. NPDC023805 TaxID=3154696 RepID=UPI0034101ADF